MADVSLRLLGPPSLLGADTRPVPLNTPTSLLLYLAAAGDWVPRRELAYLYKPDSSETEALTYLRLQLHRAAQYPWAAALETDPHQVRWLVNSDLKVLRTAHDEARWADALKAYGGGFLLGVDSGNWATYDSWLELEREAALQLYRSALRAYADERLAAGDAGAAFDATSRLLAEDELDESALRQVLRLAPAADRVPEALRRFTRFEALLAAELGLIPDGETVALAARLRSRTAAATAAPNGDAPAPAPYAPAPDTGSALHQRPATPLPKATTRFIGREAELAELAELIDRPECRLVTLVGLGGSGKTRLALELARRRQRQFAGGAMFLPLVEADSAAQVVMRLAAALGVDASTDVGLEEAVVRELEQQDLLLVLDNLEQVAGAAQLLTRLLAGTESLTILATSRGRVGLAAEWLYDLSGLSVPALDESARGADAVELFVSAAKRVQPRLKLGPKELAHVALICRQVDGLPLALELAAAWVRAMPLAQVAEEIGRGFELLNTDLADLAERHRSVETIMERTWSGLTGHQARTLAAMTVFQDGCNWAAAESVTEGQLPILLSLVNQSLLFRDSDGRFGCHPLVALYAARKLAQDQELWRHANEAHARYFADFLAEFSPANMGSESPSLRELEPEIGNVEKAWFYLVKEGRSEHLAEAVDALLNYYTVIGQYRRGTALGTETLQLLAPEGPQEVRVRCSVLLALSNMARESGLLTDALEYAQQATAEAHQGQQKDMQARARRFEADVLQMLGRYDEAEPAYEEAVAAFTQLNETAELANTLNSLASMDAVRERFEAATKRFEHCVTLFEEVDDVLAKAIALNNLGYLADAQGQVALAAQRYEASLRDFERIQFTRGIAAVKNNLVVLYGNLGRLDEAEELAHQSLSMKVEMEDRLGIVVSLKNLGDLHLLRGEPESAVGRYLPAIRLALETEAVPRLLQVLPGFAEALQQRGDAPLAQLVRRALALHPLTPPSVRDKALSTLSLAEWQEDSAPLADLVAQLKPQLDELPATY